MKVRVKIDLHTAPEKKHREEMHQAAGDLTNDKKSIKISTDSSNALIAEFTMNDAAQYKVVDSIGRKFRSNVEDYDTSSITFSTAKKRSIRKKRSPKKIFLEEAVEQFTQKATQIFTVTDVVDFVSPLIRKTRPLKDKIENLLFENPWVFRDEGNDRYVPRVSYFHKAQFQIIPQTEEIEQGILIPGHRFVPFCDPEVLPAKCKLQLPEGKVARRKKIRRVFKDILVYHNLFGLVRLIKNLVLEEDANREAFSNESAPQNEVSFTVFNMKKFYEKHAFKPGDALITTVENWKRGIYFVEYCPASELAKKGAFDKRCWRSMEDAFDDVLALYGPAIDAPEQLAQVIFRGGTELLQFPGVHIDTFLYESESVEVKIFGGETVIWKRDDPPRREATDDDVILDEFYNHLLRDKHLSEQTATRHCSRLNFFFQYLHNYTNYSALEVNSDIIDDYLGNWYIRKVLNSSKSDVHPTLTAFKKFYQYAFKRELIPLEDWEDIMEACQDRMRYMRRFDGYMALDPDSDSWEEDFENWLYDWDDDSNIVSTEINAAFEPNLQLQQALGGEKLNHVPVLADFTAYLDYLQENNRVKLTSSNSWLPRSHLLSLNNLMTHPEKLSTSINQDKSTRIHGFYRLAGSLRLYVISDQNKLEVSPRLEKFKALTPEEQFVVLFETMWNDIPWSDFKEPYSGGRPERIQQKRTEIAYRLSCCQPGKEYPYRIHHLKVRKVEGTLAELTSGIFMDDVLETRIFPLLKDFGLVSFQYKKKREDWMLRRGWGIETYSITELGMKIFRSIGRQMNGSD